MFIAKYLQDRLLIFVPAYLTKVEQNQHLKTSMGIGLSAKQNS